jgi:hypothetical protein
VKFYIVKERNPFGLVAILRFLVELSNYFERAGIQSIEYQ